MLQVVMSYILLFDGTKAEADFYCSAPTPVGYTAVCLNSDNLYTCLLSTISIFMYLLQVLYKYAFSCGAEPIAKPFAVFQVILYHNYVDL